MKTPSSIFGWFDRLILGAIFVGVLMVGIGMIKALEAATEAVIASKVAINETREVADKADRNFNATTGAAEDRRISDQKRGNATIGLFLPVLLDIDEDVEQLKAKQNITRGISPEDLLVIDFNGTHLNINNSTSIFVPSFRELLGATNASGNADILGNNSGNVTAIKEGQ
jgi:hypothetical protein